MSHRFEVISDYTEQRKYLAGIFSALGEQMPAKDHAVFFVEFDEAGEVIGFLALQNKLFAEGLYCRDANANIRTLWNMLGEHMKERFKGKDLLVMASTAKMASVVRGFKCKELPWQVFRREF